MTHAPLVTVRNDESLDHARRLIYATGVRHLPVLEGKSLVGILSDRDLKLAYAVDADRAQQLTVGDVCNMNLYVALPDASLSEVANRMAEESIGSALIVDPHGQLVGIFTALDACRALAHLSKERDEPS